MKWLRENKRVVGAVLAFLAGGLQAIGQTEAAVAIGMLSAMLVGGGAMPSDREEKTRR